MDKIKYDTTLAHQRYKLADGTACPGVTTVLGIMEKQGLHRWFYECGLAKPPIDPFKKSAQAANIGSIAHFMVECHLKGVEPDTSEFSPADLSKAENSVIKFMSWWDSSGFEFSASELQLVSAIEGYGGTLDILAKKDGEMCLIDLKTSKRIYGDEYWWQLSAYANLFCENNPFVELKRFIICRIGKEDEGDFEVQERKSLVWELDVFRKCLALYKVLKSKTKE